MDLTISIVNWNVKEYLEKCLESIFRYSSGIELEVYVVDNASHDGSAAMVRERFPQVKVIENRENRGFGCAHNQVIPLAQGKYILFLNPDTEMLPETLPKILALMDDHPEAGGCMGIEIGHKERAEHKKVFVFKKMKYLWWHCCLIAHRIFPHRWFTDYCLGYIAETIKSSRHNMRTVEYHNLEGGLLVVRQEALRQAGLFNPEYFLREEGAELTGRIRELGWKLYLFPDITLIHYRRRSFDQTTDEQCQKMEKDWERQRGRV